MLIGYKQHGKCFGAWAAARLPERSACFDPAADLAAADGRPLSADIARAGKSGPWIDELRGAVVSLRYYDRGAR